MSGFAPSYFPYLGLRGLCGVGVALMGLASFALATEPIGPSWRGSAGLGTQYFFALGASLLPLLAWLVCPIQMAFCPFRAFVLFPCYHRLFTWPNQLTIVVGVLEL